MMKQPQPNAKKGIDYGKKRIRLLDPMALVISIVFSAIMGTLAALSNHYGFDESWYGDVLTTGVSVLCFFGLLNIGYVLISGITVENGEVFLGVDSEKKPITFYARDLVKILVCEEDRKLQPEDARLWKNVVLRFELRDGTVKEYETHYLTRKKYRKMLTYFDLEV